jgi:aminoglycoside 2''-phosphotransferase
MAGWEYLILDVNGDYIFRLPLHQDHDDRLKNEVSLVNSLSKIISAPIPYYEFIWQSDQNSPVFAGYRKLRGVACNSRNFKKSWIENASRDLGRFLSELHNVPSSSPVTSALHKYSSEEWTRRFRKSHSEVKKFAYPLIRKKYHSECEQVWSSLDSKLHKAKFKPSVIHGDLMGGNILADPLSGHLTGIIDWSDAQLGDPAYDFAGLISVDGQLGEHTLNHYLGRERDSVMDRAELYFRTIPLREIAWGVKMNSKRIIRIGLSEFARWFVQPQST